MEKLTELIRNSSLQEFDQEDLIALFETATEEDITTLSALVEEDPELIMKLSENFKMKREAFITRDTSLIDKIIAYEEKEVNHS